VLVVVPRPDAAGAGAQRANGAARAKGGAERGAGGAALGASGVLSVRDREQDVSPLSTGNNIALIDIKDAGNKW